MMSRNRDDLYTPKPWETEDVMFSNVNVQACAYNAAVNCGSERAAKKMRGLIAAINLHARIEGRAQMEYLLSQAVIESYTPCDRDCGMRPGGLFHVTGCENDGNHPVYRARRDKAKEMLPEGKSHAAWVTLVGTDADRILG